jgi:hypothetical protein
MSESKIFWRATISSTQGNYKDWLGGRGEQTGIATLPRPQSLTCLTFHPCRHFPLQLFRSSLPCSALVAISALSVLTARSVCFPPIVLTRLYLPTPTSIWMQDSVTFQAYRYLSLSLMPLFLPLSPIYALGQAACFRAYILPLFPTYRLAHCGLLPPHIFAPLFPSATQSEC